MRAGECLAPAEQTASRAESYRTADQDLGLLAGMVAWVESDKRERSLAAGAANAVGLQVTADLPGLAVRRKQEDPAGRLVYDKAFQIVEYAHQRYVVVSCITPSRIDLWRISPDTGEIQRTFHGELSESKVISHRAMGEYEARDGLRTELEFWRQELAAREHAKKG